MVIQSTSQQLSNIGRYNSQHETFVSLAHVLHYVVSANYYVAVTRETARAEDHVKKQLDYITIL